LGLVFAVAATAEAETLSVGRLKPARPHAAKTAEPAASKSAGLGGVAFSDPYAPPVGVQKTVSARFPEIRTDSPVEPKGGISLSAGQDAPDEPFTGGLKFRF